MFAITRLAAAFRVQHTVVARYTERLKTGAAKSNMLAISSARRVFRRLD